jgi:hypothetical protein
LPARPVEGVELLQDLLDRRLVMSVVAPDASYLSLNIHVVRHAFEDV